MRTISLFVTLFVFWLALSGQSKPFLVVGGVVASLLCLFAAWRMGTTDREGHPTYLLPRTLVYYPWLIKEIIKSAWNVSKLILHPRLPISPTMTRVKASQRTSEGITTYANSITLTPGTITVSVRGNVLTVHALERSGALDVEAGGMDARVTKFEGSR